MLSGLQKKAQESSAPESSKNTVVQLNSLDSSWKETPDDVVKAGSKQCMSHQERYEFVKNRVYSPVKPSKIQDSE